MTLLDPRMPMLDGVGVIDEIRKEDTSARIIMLTTYDTDNEICRAIKAGAKGYLLKDARREELLDCIRKVNRGDTCIPQALVEKLAAGMSSETLTGRELGVLTLLVAPELPNAVKKAAKKDIDGEIGKAIQGVNPKPWKSSDHDVAAAYHIARLIRNAYSHAPFAPTWMIHPNLQGKVFAIADVVTLDTTGLHGAPFDWRHYGARPLTMFRFCRFVRTQILGDEPSPRTLVPMPRSGIYQVGDMILTQVDEIPSNAAPVEIERLPDGSIPLGGGYVLKSGGKANDGDP